MKLELILEKGDGEWWGRLESVPGTLLITSGKSILEVTDNLRDLLADYVKNEGRRHMNWKNISLEAVEFYYIFDAHYSHM